MSQAAFNKYALTVSQNLRIYFCIRTFFNNRSSFIFVCLILNDGLKELTLLSHSKVTYTILFLCVSINRKRPDPDSKLFANLLTRGGFRGFPQHEDWWLNFPYLPAQLCELSCVWRLF